MALRLKEREQPPEYATRMRRSDYFMTIAGKGWKSEPLGDFVHHAGQDTWVNFEQSIHGEGRQAEITFNDDTQKRPDNDHNVRISVRAGQKTKMPPLYVADFERLAHIIHTVSRVKEALEAQSHTPPDTSRTND